MANVMVTLQKLANENTAKTFKYNAQEAKASRDWQKSMSDTSHQREVADLKKAGLNPVLSANSGAQSYSTQSASATADSAVNAIGNVESSRTSAAATRYAADRSLAASQAIASAQRYSAAMAYEAQKYHSDAAERASKYTADMNYKIALEKPVSNPTGIIDKVMSNTGIYGAIRNNTASVVKKAANNLIKNPSVMFRPNNSGQKINGDNFVLTKQGMIQVNRGLDSYNLLNTSRNRDLFVRAFVFGEKDAISQMNFLIKRSNIKKSSTAARWYHRSGSGIW